VGSRLRVAAANRRRTDEGISRKFRISGVVSAHDTFSIMSDQACPRAESTSSWKHERPKPPSDYEAGARASAKIDLLKCFDAPRKPRKRCAENGGFEYHQLNILNNRCRNCVSLSPPAQPRAYKPLPLSGLPVSRSLPRFARISDGASLNLLYEPGSPAAR